MSATLKLIVEIDSRHQVSVLMPHMHGNVEDEPLRAALAEVCRQHRCLDAHPLHASGVEELVLWCKDAARLSELAGAMAESGWQVQRLHEDHARLVRKAA
jgi:hypothetical protein